MRIALVCILLGFLMLTTNACSQEGGSSKSGPQPEIALDVLPIHLVDGVPQGFVFVLTNVSGADLRLPQPDAASVDEQQELSRRAASARTEWNYGPYRRRGQSHVTTLPLSSGATCRSSAPWKAGAAFLVP
jgi:hypothetical protein